MTDQLAIEPTEPDRPNWRQRDETERDFVRRMIARARSNLTGNQDSNQT